MSIDFADFYSLIEESSHRAGLPFEKTFVMLSLRVSILNVAIEGFLAPRPADPELAPTIIYLSGPSRRTEWLSQNIRPFWLLS